MGGYEQKRWWHLRPKRWRGTRPWRGCASSGAWSRGGRGTRLRAVASAGVHIVTPIVTAPDDHLTAGPHCRVQVSWFRRIGYARSRPDIRVGIVPTTGLEDVEGLVSAAPDDHFDPSPA